MDRALFLAMSGAKQNMQALQLRANNLANVSTTGFRADLAQARSMQAYGEGMPTRVFSMTELQGLLMQNMGYRYRQQDVVASSLFGLEYRSETAAHLDQESLEP